MDYFSVKAFRGIETKEDATDQDRTVLRELAGLLPVPQGALSNGPRWQLLYGIDDLPDRAATALAAANQAKAHILRLTRGSRIFLIVWSIPAARPLGFFEVVSAPADSDLTSTGGVTLTYIATAPYADKDPSALWFASRVGSVILLGNGMDANLTVSATGTVTVFGPSTPPVDLNNRARVRIPPCTCFRLNERRNLFASGNAAAPLRVWITDTPTAPNPALDGIQSLSRNFIDIHPPAGATRITALSLFGSYITAHTDTSPVNLYGVDNTADGWKCQQAASAAAASAINPACVGDALGDASFYLGADLELYSDQAVRGGPWEKRTARDQDIVTAQAAEVWNREMLRNANGWGFHVLYDTATRLFWVFARSIYGTGMVWAYYERTRAIAGPIHYPDAVVSTPINGIRPTTVATVITRAGEILWAPLGSMVETEASDVEAPGTALGADYLPTLTEPTPVAGVPVVGFTSDRTGCVEKVGGVEIGAVNPWNRLAVVDADNYSLTEWYNNATLVRFESPWQDLSSPAQFKNLLEVEATFDRDSRAYVGVCVENERGMRRFRWLGCTHGRTKPMRAALNLMGVRFRVRVVGVVFNNARVILRDMRLGYTIAGAD